MYKIQQRTTIALLCAALGLGGFITGKVSSQSQINQLEQKVQTAKLENNLTKSENYQLHLDLIQRGNPRSWELYGDPFGNWGYRKADETAILGTIGDGYIYLTQK